MSSSIRDRLWRRLAANAGLTPTPDRQLMHEAKDELEKQADEVERLLHYEVCMDEPGCTCYAHLKAEVERLRAEVKQAKRTIEHKHLTKELLRVKEAELDRLREWVAAVEDGYDKQKAEIERLRALAIRAWHSFRSGLSATGGCRDGLTDADILELVKLSNVEVAKLRGHDSVAATIAEAERQAKIPKMPGEREDEPIE